MKGIWNEDEGPRVARVPERTDQTSYGTIDKWNRTDEA